MIFGVNMGCMAFPSKMRSEDAGGNVTQLYVMLTQAGVVPVVLERAVTAVLPAGRGGLSAATMPLGPLGNGMRSLSLKEMASSAVAAAPSPTSLSTTVTTESESEGLLKPLSVIWKQSTGAAAAAGDTAV